MATAIRSASGKLAAVGEAMRAETERRNLAHRALANGLELVMQRADGRWRLALGREGVYPSDVEVRICLDAFNIPDDSNQVRRVVASTHPKTQRQRIYHIVECFWVEQ